MTEKQEAKIIGDKVRELRVKNNLTQEKLSEKLGIDNRCLSRIETGKNLPSFKVARKLSELFNFDFYSLINDTPIDKINAPDEFVIQSTKIINSACDNNEKEYYLEMLKFAQKSYKTFSKKDKD